MNSIKCTIMRGGTSKAIFINKEDLPKNKENWDNFILEIFGSPDVTQIDGLGGANSLTSKIAIISTSSRENIDIDYLFGQVSLNSSKIAWNSNCGNISSAVGPYAVNEGLVKSKDGFAKVRIYNENTKKIILSKFEVNNGSNKKENEVYIAGVPNKASPVWLYFYYPQNTMFPSVLPTKNQIDKIFTSKGTLEISIIDSGTVIVFVKASDIGFKGNELPNEFSENELLFLEEIRSISAELCNITKKELATQQSPAIPKIAIFSKPLDYNTINGEKILRDNQDITIRMLSMNKPHSAIAITGVIAITTAINIKGTLLNKCISKIKSPLRIGHPGGIIDVSYKLDNSSQIKYVKILRTSRCLMKGVAYSRNNFE